jgi:hypothetical protein
MIVSNTVRMRSLIALLLIINTVFFIALMAIVGSESTHKLRDIESLSYTWYLSLLGFLSVVWFLLPKAMNRGIMDVRKIITDISRGRYNIEFKLFEYDYRKDEQVSELLAATKAMLTAIQQIDKAKKEKIVEHLSRINAMLRLAENGFIILSIDGHIRFINDVVGENFPQLIEGTNMLGRSFPPEIENSIKRYAIQVFKTHNRIESQQFFLPSLKRQLQLRSQVVKDEQGRMVGIVLGLYNLEKKQTDRLSEIEGLR